MGHTSPLTRASLVFTAIGVVCLIFADLSISTIDPWPEMGRLLVGMVTPNFLATEQIFSALAYTVAFAIIGVVLGNVLGFGLALAFHSRAVRVFCAVIRAVHELFWALIFLQLFGLSPLTGILAIAIPYAGIIAKVYSEILEEADQSPLRILPPQTGRVSAFFFARLPDALPHLKTYSLYRLECGLRSSAVLGFVGLPTLGFHLETAFRQGHFSEVSALLILFYLVIATIRFWMRKSLLPVYLIAGLFILPWGVEIHAAHILRFFTQDIVPHPLRVAESFDAATLAAFGGWLNEVVIKQALPGAVATVQLTMIALLATGMLALVFFPLISPHFLNKHGRLGGHLVLVVIRSTPEYVLAYVLLQLWGPSMLPAVIALALHNGAIIGHLIGRHTGEIKLRIDAPKGLNLYGYVVVPRIYGQLLAYLFYRWEVILRETAILGILGIATLGFYIDSAFADIRYDRAVVLILITAALNIGVDAISRTVRSRLRLKTSIENG